MPHTSSAEKRHRQDEKRRLRNRAAMKTLKGHIKKFLVAVEEDNPDAKAAEFKAAVKRLDKAASKRIIHPNAAARKKSQLARKLAAKPVAAGK